MFWRWFKTTDQSSTQVKQPAQIELRCPLCGKQFPVNEAAQCETCILAKKCGMVMCPRCRYEFAP